MSIKIFSPRISRGLLDFRLLCIARGFERIHTGSPEGLLVFGAVGTPGGRSTEGCDLALMGPMGLMDWVWSQKEGSSLGEKHEACGFVERGGGICVSWFENGASCAMELRTSLIHRSEWLGSCKVRECAKSAPLRVQQLFFGGGDRLPHSTRMAQAIKRIWHRWTSFGSPFF